MDRFLIANAEFSKFSRNYMQLKKDLPIRPSEMGVLNILANFPGPHTSMQLAKRLGVSKPMIAAHIAALMKKGYVEKRQSAQDKRVFYIQPTEKAWKLVAEAKAGADVHLERMLQSLGAERFDAMVELIGAANLVMEEHSGDPV